MPLPLLAAAGIGAALGAIKHAAVDAPRMARQNKLATETTRYSPWTGLIAKQPDEESLFGNMFQGGLTGAAFNQGLGSAAPAGGSSWADLAKFDIQSNPALIQSYELPDMKAGLKYFGR